MAIAVACWGGVPGDGKAPISIAISSLAALLLIYPDRRLVIAQLGGG